MQLAINEITGLKGYAAIISRRRRSLQF